MFGTWDTAKEYSIPTAIIISSIFSVGFILSKRHSDEERYKHEVATKKAIEDLKFDAGKIYCKNGIALIVNTNLTEILYVRGYLNDPVVIHPNSIIEMVLEIDECVVSKSSSGSGSSLMGASIGGTLLGGTGALVGAIAGKNPSIESSSGVRAISIKMVIDNSENQLLVLDFLSSNYGFKKGGWLLDGIMKEANEWWATLTVLINKGRAN